MTKRIEVPAADQTLQLKVTLEETHPPVWRRIQVPASTTLSMFHGILQAAFGWTGTHLHQFVIGDDERYTDDIEENPEAGDERGVKLAHVLPARKTGLYYEYDFGDCWSHRVAVEKILPADPGGTYPRCLAGKRACPPEDCGGPSGYDELVTALRDPEHREHESARTLAGEDFDPEAFDLAVVNQDMRAAGLSKSTRPE